MQENTIYNNDCHDKMAEWVSDERNWGRIDLCVTDPPYDVDYDEKSTHYSDLGISKNVENIRKNNPGFDKHKLKLWENRRKYLEQNSNKQIDRDKNYHDKAPEYNKFSKWLYLLMKNDSHVYIWCSEPQAFIWRDMMERNGFIFNQILVWCKNRSTFDITRKLKYAYKHEVCMFFRKGYRKLNEYGETILHYDVYQSMDHPTMKPLEMIKYQVRMSSDPGDLVFDPFMGSGTLAVAALQLGRRYIGCEISPHFHKMCLDRISKEGVIKQRILI